jgi:hypothetical protein
MILSFFADRKLAKLRLIVVVDPGAGGGVVGRSGVFRCRCKLNVFVGRVASSSKDFLKI